MLRTSFRFLGNKRLISTDNLAKNDVVFQILSGEDKGIAVIGLNKLNGRNSLSKSFVENLENILEQVSNNNDIRTLVFRSHIPGIFCAGADLKERLKMNNSEVQLFVNRSRRLMNMIENTSVPVIAAIDGAALGGGLELALACDIRVASQRAKIGLVETKLAIMPGAGGTQRLSRIIGPAKAKELIFTSRILNGSEAQEYGIVNHCVQGEDDAAFNKAMNIAREILPNGPMGLKMAKQAINKGMETDTATGLAIEELCYAQLLSTKDRIEGLKAFQEKRKPNYTGN